MEKTLRRIISYLLLSLILGTTLPVKAQTPFESRYTQAERYYAEGRYDDAVVILKASLEGVGLTEQQRSKAQALLERCQSESYARRNRPVTMTFNSTPTNAKVSIDGGSGVYTPFSTDLRPGQHSVLVEKEGYFPLDTTIVVASGAPSPKDPVKVSLKPQFATIRLDVKPEDGFSFSLGPEAEVGGHSLDLSVEAPVLQEADAVKYYQVYQDGVVLVPRGAYVLVLTAEGFDSKVLNLNLSDGENRSISVWLPAKKGTLEFEGNALADGTTVFLDGEAIGTLPLEKRTVSAGTHIISYEKPGMMTGKDEYVIDVPEGKTVRAWAGMKWFNTYEVSGDMDGVTILVDGKDAGKSPVTVPLTEGKHRLMARKEGYYSGEITVSVDERKEGTTRITLPLMPTRTVAFGTDRADRKESLSLYTKDGHVLAEREALPCEVAVPMGDQSLKAVVWSDNALVQRHYKGPVKVKAEDNAHQIRTFSKLYLQWISAEASLGIPNKGTPQSFGSVSLLKFSPLPFAGLSTALVKADLGKMDTFGLYSVSFLLLNWDLRVGGSITKDIDAGLIASFAYHPDLSSLLGMPMVSGKELFAGAEVSTRFPYANVNLKAGVEVYSETRFVVKLGFSLGGKDSKGDCFLRF